MASGSADSTVFLPNKERDIRTGAFGKTSDWLAARPPRKDTF